MNFSFLEASAEIRVSTNKKNLITEYVGEVQVQVIKKTNKTNQTNNHPKQTNPVLFLVIKGRSFLCCSPETYFICDISNTQNLVEQVTFSPVSAIGRGVGLSVLKVNISYF